MILAPATEEAFTPALLDAVASAREEVGRLTSQIVTAEQQAEERVAIVRSDADSVIHGLLAARVEAEQLLAEARTDLSEAEKDRDLVNSRAVASEAKAAAAHQRMAEAEEARAAEMARRAASHERSIRYLPRSIGRLARRAAKSGWRAVTGASGQPPGVPLPQPTEQAPPPLRPADGTAEAYVAWYAAQQPSRSQLALQGRLAATLGIQPRFSILVPVFRTPIEIFIAMVESVQQASHIPEIGQVRSSHIHRTTNIHTI